MVKIIYDLPDFLSAEIPYKELSLDFMKETEPNEKIIEIVIYSNLKSGVLLQKEDLICDMLIDKYPKTKREYIILSDYI